MLTTTLKILAHPWHTPLCTRTPHLKRQLWAVVVAAALSLVTIALGQGVAAPAGAPADNNFIFDMVPSQGAKTCLPKAQGQVTITSLGPAETMHVEESRLPPDTEFDISVIPVPDPPFVLCRYQRDLKTHSYGQAVPG